MSDKFSAYELFGILVPGILLNTWTWICFPHLSSLTPPQRLPDAVLVLILTAAGLLSGHLIQTLASIIEPFLYLTFGGKPSEVVFTRGLGRYMSASTAMAFREQLKPLVGDNATDEAVFFVAQGLATANKDSKANTFNALYAFHRGMFVLVIASFSMMSVSRVAGATKWDATLFWSLLASFMVLTFVAWFRTRQRAMYYVREVLICAAVARRTESK